MTAGRAEYLWRDDGLYKNPTRLSAPEYIELLLNWVAEVINDTSIFPVDEGAKFPRNFMTEVKNIYKRLFRLYAHLYCHHAEKIKSIGANAHLNTTFKHFSQRTLTPHTTDTHTSNTLSSSHHSSIAAIPLMRFSFSVVSCLCLRGVLVCVLCLVYFVLEFNLMSKVDLAPLDRLIQKMKENDANQRALNGAADARPPNR